jgi:hypothetical protein
MIIGRALFIRNVVAVLTRVDSALVTSPPVAIVAKKFESEAFIDASDPEKVAVASSAVVPVMPNSP